jgi:hypothetical protein
MNMKNNDIAVQITQIHQLAEQAIPVLTNETNDIIQNKTNYKLYIENYLDRLLDFSFHPKALNLFKQLCRYYLNIDPVATRRYVYFYKDMYEND